ncbi:MAG: M48 family metalloprotease [Armatimonadetes bacterium]|nr:M48 family metalloprotease [Armatimonadota bacterium]
MNRHYRRMAFAVLIPAWILALAGCNPSQLVSQNQEIERKYKAVNDPALQARINEMGQALAKCSDRANSVYTFTVLDIKDVNAVSRPGGWVYIYKGLVNETKNKPDELAGVIAHEIGHVAARHHATMLGREIQASILVGTLTKGDLRQVAGLFANITLLRYSRKQEYEADKLGIKYMYRCKQWNAQGLVDFFGSLLKLEKNKPSEFEQIFRTHPVTQERIKRAQAYLDDLRSGKESAD